MAGLPAEATRRFEAFLLDWRGAAIPERRADATALRDLIEELCELGAEVAVASDADVGEIDARLGARPRGPGSLHLLVDRGSAVFRVGHDGPDLVDALPASVREEVARWFLAHLERHGIRPAQVLMTGEETGSSAGSPGCDSLASLLHNQVELRRRGAVPELDRHPSWTIELKGIEPESERVAEALLTLADGRVGSRGSTLFPSRHSRPGVLMAGAYRDAGPETELLPLPAWQQLGEIQPDATARRLLDLQTGLLSQEVEIPEVGTVRALQLSSLARPGLTAMRVEGPPAVLESGAGSPLHVPAGMPAARKRGRLSTWSAPCEQGSVCAAAGQRNLDARCLERFAVYRRGAVADAGACEEETLARLRAAEDTGFETILNEHRTAWAERWEEARVDIPGQPELERSVRFALFHLMASVVDHEEAAVGARGLSGPAYRGHVFWDTDVFVLPMLAATHPTAARAILEYRIRRLPAALAAARRGGRRGAHFPWESAASGEEVAPRHGLDRGGRPVLIRTGELEEHIVADVAWSACCYADWSGDRGFLEGPGRDLVVETARWWASRIEVDPDGSAHIRGVIGPDEYHEAVDDDAYTNVMARWNLRRGAELGERDAERGRWLELAEALVDNYDPETGLYEQFAGFFSLEDVVIADFASRPISATMLLGSERVSRAQVLKQADVLMAHHLLPDEVAAGSLGPNLSYYEPRTAHASSLSPGIHASLLARAGRLDQALEMLGVTARIDLDGLTGTTAAGLHLAAMGSLWQAIAFGLVGLRPEGDALRIDPHLPPGWRELGLRLSFRGSRLRLRLAPGEVRVQAEPSVQVRVDGGPRQKAGSSGLTVAIPGREGGKER